MKAKSPPPPGGELLTLQGEEITSPLPATLSRIASSSFTASRVS